MRKVLWDRGRGRTAATTGIGLACAVEATSKRAVMGFQQTILGKRTTCEHTDEAETELDKVHDSRLLQQKELRRKNEGDKGNE